jgi:hypothetical protein
MNATAPPVLFKYFSFERGLQSLRDETLFLTQPKAFNDPFDHNPFAATDVLFRQGDGPWHRLSDVQVTTRERALKIASIVVLSLTPTRTSLLMWAHYAGAHTGIAIGFDAVTDLLRNASQHRLLRPVVYVPERPSALTLEELSDEAVVFTKSDQWGYEDEWRLVDSLQSADGEGEGPGKHWWPFRLDPARVREVILGCRCEAADEQAILEVLAEPRYRHVSVFTAVPDLRTYSLVLEPIPRTP